MCKFISSWVYKVCKYLILSEVNDILASTNKFQTGLSFLLKSELFVPSKENKNFKSNVVYEKLNSTIKV